MKKIYLFYLHADEINGNLYPGCTVDDIKMINGQYVSFYGWTPNKQVRKQFKKLRNMDLFYEQTYEVDDCELEKFANKNSDTLIEDRLLTTKCNDNGVYKRDVVFVLSTQREIDYVVFQKSTIFDGLINLDAIPFNVGFLMPESFSGKFRKAMSFFCFDDIVSMITQKKRDVEFDNFKRITLLENEVIGDHFALFIHIFQNTYKKEIKTCTFGNSTKNQIMRKTTKRT